MNLFQKQLHDISYSRRGLGKSCAFILLLGFAFAGVSGLVLQRIRPPAELEKDLIKSIEFQYFIAQDLGLKELGILPDDSRFEGPLGALFFLPMESWLPALQFASKQADPLPGKRFALGLWYQREGLYTQAIDLFHQENLDSPHPLVRDWELRTAFKARDVDTINRLKQNPAYTDQIDGRFMMRLGIALNNWPMILQNFWAAQYENLPLDHLFLALISGTIWTLLILSLFPKLCKVYFPLALLALALGWMSTWPTIWLNIWMDHHFELNEGTDFISSLLYFLVSVGFREELCKLLLFSPFLFRVIKPGRDLEALLFGALVGLGFAIEENINYFHAFQGGGVVVVRFVSANLLHLSLTAAASLSLTRAVRDPGKWMADAVQILAMVIGLHAIYNTLLTHPVPGLGDISYFSGAVLAGCAYLLFREVQTLAPMRGYIVSRTAIFCWGFCVLLNMELLGSVAIFPFNQAIYFTGQAALSAVFIGYVFIHQIQEPLAP